MTISPVQNILDANCHHLPWSLTQRLSEWPFAITEYKAGWFLSVPADFRGIPQALWELLTIAKGRDCSLIHLHSDGAIHEGLPFYNW